MRRKLPRINEERIIKKYLDHPVTIEREKRWGEVAYIKQYLVGLFDTYVITWWHNYKWSTEGEYDAWYEECRG